MLFAFFLVVYILKFYFNALFIEEEEKINHLLASFRCFPPPPILSRFTSLLSSLLCSYDFANTLTLHSFMLFTCHRVHFTVFLLWYTLHFSAFDGTHTTLQFHSATTLQCLKVCYYTKPERSNGTKNATVHSHPAHPSPRIGMRVCSYVCVVRVVLAFAHSRT